VFKKDRTFAIKTLFYYILSTVPFKVVPSTGDTPFPTFLLLLECFLKSTFCDGAQFSDRIFLNLRVFKKRPNFLNSAPTSREGALFKKFGLFVNTRVQFGASIKSYMLWHLMMSVWTISTWNGVLALCSFFLIDFPKMAHQYRNM
jgi:hypothetical protein